MLLVPGPVQHLLNPGRGSGDSFKAVFSFSLRIWIGCGEVCGTVLSHYWEIECPTCAFYWKNEEWGNVTVQRRECASL